jgi:branched-subunit amino acid aminotransferase/4-amino-4-deoxychorismate lyase
MRHSLEIIGLDSDRLVAELSRAIPEFIDRNRGQIAEDDDWTITAFVTPGVSGASPASASTLNLPTVCVHGRALPFGQWANRYETGVRVVISDVRQVPGNCWPSELKCRSRMHFYLADRRAAERQPGARAILLDQDGLIAEATTANVILYRAGEGLISPPADHILFGVSLSVIAELAVTLNIPFAARPLSVDEFRTADEALLASTSICVQPIVSCDGEPIGDGRPGPTYRRLLAAWSNLVGIAVAEQARRCAERCT